MRIDNYFGFIGQVSIEKGGECTYRESSTRLFRVVLLHHLVQFIYISDDAQWDLGNSEF